ncbi:unnamed protein product, partial [Mesorhabditis belari]|uniref:Lamin n=1 Tax=Mesorhabditis belari TaxID=2138241 RepID=A0AAF3J2V6_9BILA
MPTKRRAAQSDDSNSTLDSSHVSSRQEEKEFLGNLNSRLGAYIDRVRQLEQENNRLIVQIKDIEIVEKKEKDNLAGRYEVEKDRLRQQLDINAARLAKLEIERDTAVAGSEELEARVIRLERDLKSAENQRAQAQGLLDNIQARLSGLENKNKSLDAENGELHKENDRLRKQVAALKKSLEDESFLRAELQNKLRSATEELDFERNNHRQQIEDVRRKRQVEMTTMSKQIESEYENQFNERLQEMRQDFSDKLAANRANFDDQYKNKLNEAHDSAERFRDEAFRLRLQVSDLEKQHQSMDTMQRKVAALESELDRLRREMDDKLASKDDRIYQLNQEIQRMMQEYQDLIDIKIQLDAELKVYQALLEGEESRLNLTSGTSPNVSTRHVSFTTSSGTKSAQRGAKRKRVSNGDEYPEFSHHQRRYESGNKGAISIEGADIDGKSISLRNNSEEDVSLGGWELKVMADDREVVYKFNQKLTLRGNHTVNVWSADSGTKHSPPHDLVMKNQNWPIGSNPEAALVDSFGEKQAWMLATHDSQSGENPGDRCSIM